MRSGRFLSLDGGRNPGSIPRNSQVRSSWPS